jgi:hypothetical protein
MKQFIQILHGAGALLFAAALAVSCSGPLDPPASQNVPAPQDLPAPQDSSNTGTAVIRIGDGGGDGPSRTIMPTAPDAFSRYALTLTKGSTTLTPDAAGIAGTGVAVQLESGDWTAAVSAYRQWTATGGSSTEYLAAKGSAALTVTVGGSNSVAVPVEPVPIEAAAGVKGIFSWNITLPEGVTSAELKLGDTTPVNLLTTATGSVEKAAGTYNLFITMKKGGLNAGLYEWAYVYPGLESPAVFDFRSGGADALVFTDTVLLAGTVSASIPAGATALTVKAYSNSAHTSAITAPEASVSSSGGTWLLKIPASYIGQAVYLTATADVAVGYAANTATQTVANLPARGQAGIALTVPVERLFVPVTDITGIATGKLSGTDLSLATATVVPDNADNQTITWSVANAGTTGATIVDGNKLRTTATGTAIVKATITNGRSLTTEPRDYTQEFEVTVTASFIPVTNITGVPSATMTLSGTVEPSNATNKTITWEVANARTTGATIVDGNKLHATAAGPATIKATVINGRSLTTEPRDYTQEFEVTVTDTTAPILSEGSWEALTTTAKFTSSEAGTYYYMVRTTSSDVPSVETILAQSGSTAIAGQNSISVTGLTAGTQYNAYIVVKDMAGNVSERLTILITATFVVTVPINNTGIVTASPTNGTYGTTITLNNTPNDHLKFAYYTVNGSRIPENTFTLSGNATVDAVFRVNSVQDEITSKTRREEYPISNGYIGMQFDNDLSTADCVLLTYKVGKMEHMFLQYISKPRIAQYGVTFSTQDSIGSTRSVQTTHIESIAKDHSETNYDLTTISEKVGAEVTPVEGVTVNAEISHSKQTGSTVTDGWTVVTSDSRADSYSDTIDHTDITNMDFSSSIYEQGKPYAWAAFADVGVYQIVRYNIVTGYIEPIPGESLYFNVESDPVVAVYEVPANALAISDSQTLKPFQRQAVTVTGLATILPSPKSIIPKMVVYDGSTDVPNGRVSSAQPRDVKIAGDLLKTYWGYTKVRVKGWYELRAHNGSPEDQHIWMDMDGTKVIYNNGDLKVDGTVWKRYGFNFTADILNFTANSVFHIGFQSLNHGFLGMGDYGWWFNSAEVEFILEK